MEHIDRDLIGNIDINDIDELESLYQAILSMKDVNEMHKFFLDLCSKNEIMSFLHRWQILLRISQGKSYEEIIRELTPDKEDDGKKKQTVSSTTISRVKACYVNPDGGYRTALKRIEIK